MLTHRTQKRRQNHSVRTSKIEDTFTSLKKVLIAALLLLTILLAPAAAVPISEEEIRGNAWKCTNPNPHLCKIVTLTLPPNEVLIPPTSGRELKLRTAQKKQAEFITEYSGEISTTGDVFFMNSPIVTSLHLQEGITGNVHLQRTLETSRPEFCHVYEVFELSLENYPAGSEALVKYTLPLSEIEEKGYNPVEIALCIYEDNIWQRLYTIYSIDDQNAYFESVTTSLGTFAIVTDGNSGDIGSFSARIGGEMSTPTTLNVSPACFVTHPVSYTATV